MSDPSFDNNPTPARSEPYVEDAASFHNATASDELKFVNHNPTDFNAFREFQKNLDSKYENYEHEKTRKEILNNLKKWEAMLPPRWSSAILSQVRPPADEAATEIKEIFKNRGNTSLFLKGESGVGKTYLAYAAVRRCIGKNWVGPSQVKIISEEALLGFAAAGFDGQARFNELLKPQYTLYLIDGIGSRNTYSVKELQLWEQLIDHIYSKSLTVFFTSTNAASVFSGALSDTAESKLDHLIGESIVTVRGDKRKLKKSEDGRQSSSDSKIGLFKG